jgi:hypothetical protein
MLKNILIIAFIAILAIVALRIALPLISWIFQTIVSLAILIAAVIGIMFLVKKLRT